MYRSCLLLTIALFGVSIVGCRKPGEVTRHSIAKSQSGLEQIRDAVIESEVADPAPSPAVATRMVVAIADRDDATWFFKITGPIDRVAQSESRWSDFLNQIRFGDDGKPAWELPDGWSEGGKKPMRFASLLLDDQSPPLEMAISSLGPNQDLLLNVNRWRGQLGLGPTSTDALESQMKTIDAAGQKLTLFDETGKQSGGSMMPPFAGGMAGRPRSVGAVGVGAEAPEQTADTIKFALPEGWTRGKSSSFVQARLLKTTDDQSAQISVVEMPASANEWLPNVKRWAGEVGMDSLTDQQMQKLTEEVKIDGVAGQLVRLIDGESEGGRATVAVMAKRGDSAWFFKLTGDKELVQQGDHDFVSFLDTVRFP